MHKGAFFQTVLMNNPSSRLVGIDPYPFPEGAEFRERMLLELEKLGLLSKFKLSRDWEEIPAATKFDVIHIDGEHTEAAAAYDIAGSQVLLQPLLGFLRNTVSACLPIQGKSSIWWPPILTC